VNGADHNGVNGVNGVAVEAGTPAPIDFDALLNNLSGDRTLGQQVLERFIETAADDLARLKSELDRGDLIEVREAAHSLKGMSATVQARELAELAQRVETAALNNDLPEAAVPLPDIQQQLESAREYVSGLFA
jgi:HPt (histidine-containing phosphotransfer) domain-containing protein